ncbi:MAG TPA: hypothetical protein VF459_14995 [Caulobacteraceae bacterium]
MSRTAAFAVFAAVAAIGAASAPPALCQPLTRDELETALKQRDQEIAALEKRIAALEAERGGEAMAAGKGVAAAAVGASDGPVVAAAAPGVSGGGEAELDDTALQALSRGLVERGALLLPKWGLEVSPSLAYSHSQKQGLVLVDTPEGISTVSDQRLRDDGLQGQLAVRLGLPWRSQLEVRVPFDWKRTASALGDGSEVRHSDSHLGDVELELSHQFLVENGWRPDLIGAVSWRFPTGRDPFSVPAVSIASGGGTNQVSGRLTALKTIDPLVVFSTLSYASNLSHTESFGRVRPGDSLGWQIGALLAVSPETSLSFGFAQEFKGRTQVDGRPIAGSDGVAAVAQFGLDQVLSSRALLDISLGLGVTRDAPDYVLMVSVPIRFR